MTKFAIRYAIMFVLLIPLQAIVFNHLILFNVAVPTLLGFLAGFLLDIFCDTPGVNALCCTVLAFVRKPLFHLYVSMDDDLAGRSPSARSMGYAAFMKFIFTATVIYSAMLFTVEAFQFFNPWLLVLRILASTVYTFVVLYAIDCLLAPKNDD